MDLLEQEAFHLMETLRFLHIILMLIMVEMHLTLQLLVPAEVAVPVHLV